MNLSLYREVSAALGRRQPRTRGEAGTHVSLRLDSMHLRPEEGAPREWVHHWVQDSEPSMGPGTGVTEETDHAGDLDLQGLMPSMSSCAQSIPP